jgi:polyribonucleotide nucleotidyltransferase
VPGHGAATATLRAPEAPGGVQRPADRQAGRVVVEREIGGRTLSLETGRMAKLADGACVVRYGDTMVLATAQSQKAPEGIDFFPLTVDYREKTAAAGMIPGGFFKREGRPTTKEILGCRFIDRSIRPMFPDGFRMEVQVLSQVLATDRENDPDVVAAIASFAALALSSIPHGRTLGMCRIGLKDEKLIVNPLWSVAQSPENLLNLTVAGHDDAIVMVEAGAKEISEQIMIEALELGHGIAREIAAMIDELCAKAGRTKMAFMPPQRDPGLAAAIEEQFGRQLRAAPLTPGTKQTRSAATKAAKQAAGAAFPPPAGSTDAQTKAWNAMVAEIVGDIVKDGERQSILGGRRADGRDHKTIRPITIEVGVLPRVHGSVLFTRGETQSLGVVTLGGTDDQQIIDGLMPEPRKRFYLHYNFPPFSVGEVKRVGSPGRREIGHGALAERGIEAVLPTREDFPYTIRITSEILESNGSSSMATVCSGTLALMDAGVKIKQPVAGIAMGLVMEGRRYAILSDILGSEDACGDMDFKVVGTGRGITALQMDIKCDGLTREIMSEALEQARQGRLHVLREMLKVLRAPREQLSPNAPRLESLTIPSEKIGLVIGPAGKNIRQMQEQFECKISIEDGGLCTITGVNADKVIACLEHIKAMTAEVEVGQVYEGRVSAIKEFGAFIEILPGQEGLCHVSELSDTFIRSVTDVVRIGDTLKVKVIGIDDFGKIKLSRKAVILAERSGGGAPPVPAERAAGADRPVPAVRPSGRPEPVAEGHLGGPRGADAGPREYTDPRDAAESREARPRFGNRPERHGRPERGDRPDRYGRAGHDDDRGPRREFGGRRDRDDRGFDERAAEEPRRFRERGEQDWGERGARTDRGEHPDFDRPSREGVPVRESREGRPFRDQGGRDAHERAERSVPVHGAGHRGDRGEHGDRGERGGRGERGDRPRVQEHGQRDRRFGGRAEEQRPGFDRPAEPDLREDRPVREDRPRHEECPPRSKGPAPRERPPVDRGPRPESAGGERWRKGPADEGARPGDRWQGRGRGRTEGAARHEPEDERHAPRRGPSATEDWGLRSELGPKGHERERDARTSPPLAEFDTTDADLGEPVDSESTPDVGGLEEIDNLLGDRPPRGYEGGRRHRGRRGGRSRD